MSGNLCDKSLVERIDPPQIKIGAGVMNPHDLAPIQPESGESGDDMDGPDGVNVREESGDLRSDSAATLEELADELDDIGAAEEREELEEADELDEAEGIPLVLPLSAFGRELATARVLAVMLLASGPFVVLAALGGLIGWWRVGDANEVGLGLLLLFALWGMLAGAVELGRLDRTIDARSDGVS